MAFDSINNANAFQDQDAATPPGQFEDEDGTPSHGTEDQRYYFRAATPNHIEHIGSNALAPTILLRLEVIEAPATGQMFLQYDLAAGGEGFIEITAAEGETQDIELTLHERDADDGFQLSVGSSGVVAYGGLANGGLVALQQIETSFNCGYSVDPEAATLAEVREYLLTRTGYAAQLASLPPGVEELYNSFAVDAQEQLYRKFPGLQTQRFFTWQLLAGRRYYGMLDSIDHATVRIDRYQVTDVQVQDLNDRWYPLARGIPPEYYTIVENINWPTRYEIRDCIEIFPAPQDAYRLRIKGHFGLARFTEDTDVTTIDAQPVKLWALGLAKLHKGSKDAGDPDRMTGYFGMARSIILSKIANTHTDHRYIPTAGDQVPYPPQPVMLEFDA